MRKAILLVLTVLLFHTGFAQLLDPLRQLTQNDSEYIQLHKKIDEIDNYFKQKYALGQFNGNVLIARKGIPIYKGSFGYAVKETREKLHTGSAFQLASTSKPFTAAAVLILVDQGKVKLDASVDQYFPGFPYKGITVRMLLSHRSGLPDYLNFSKLYFKGSYLSNTDVVDMLINKKPKAITSPDRVFDYNNTNYALLAALVEKISGISFAEFAQKNIFQPLGMHNTWVWDPRDTRRENETYGYNGAWKRRSPDMFDGVTGDKGVYSTLDDMLKWDQSWYSCKLISEGLVREAYKPNHFESNNGKNYGLGWRTTDYPDGSKLVFHNGWWHEYNIVFKRYLKDSTTIIIFSNKYNQDVYKTAGLENILFQLPSDIPASLDDFYADNSSRDNNEVPAYAMPSNPTPFQIYGAKTVVDMSAYNPPSQGGDESEQSAWHFVKKGDTLFNIAQRYNTTVELLKKWNKLAGASIHLGQKLLVKSE